MCNRRENELRSGNGSSARAASFLADRATSGINAAAANHGNLECGAAFRLIRSRCVSRGDGVRSASTFGELNEKMPRDARAATPAHVVDPGSVPALQPGASAAGAHLQRLDDPAVRVPGAGGMEREIDGRRENGRHRHRSRARGHDDDAQGARLLSVAGRRRLEGVLRTGHGGAGGRRRPFLSDEPERQAARQHARSRGARHCRRSPPTIGRRSWRPASRKSPTSTKASWPRGRPSASACRSRSGARTVYVLSASISPERILEILKSENLDEGWVATVTDRAGVVIARSQGLERVRRSHARQGAYGRRADCDPGLWRTTDADGTARAARHDLFAAIGLARLHDGSPGDRQPADRPIVGARRHARR